MIEQSEEKLTNKFIPVMTGKQLAIMSKKLVGKELSPITRTDFWPAVNSRFMEL